jgi:hypothetical protein
MHNHLALFYCNSHGLICSIALHGFAGLRDWLGSLELADAYEVFNLPASLKLRGCFDSGYAFTLNYRLRFRCA